MTETTARGAAYLAGMAAGVYGGMDDIAKQWRLDRRFAPAMATARRDALYDGWTRAVVRSLSEGRT